MKLKVKAFGVTKDYLGGKEATIELQGETVGHLRAELIRQYPQLLGLKSLYIAVNRDYADETKVLDTSDEIALIPPVSGG
jgi:molybdopterin synthase sulfur carrier subunit